MTSIKDKSNKFIKSLIDTGDIVNILEVLKVKSISIDDMFSFIWKLPETAKILTLPECNIKVNQKCTTYSEKFRSEGNRLFREKKLDKALQAYNYAILTAPHPVEKYSTSIKSKQDVSTKSEQDHTVKSEEDSSVKSEEDSSVKCINYERDTYEGYDHLAFSYANRSALLFETNQYQSSIVDISAAIKYGYPLIKQHKLIERKCRCLLNLKQRNEAKQILEELQNNIGLKITDKKELLLINNNIKKLLIKCNQGDTIDNKDNQGDTIDNKDNHIEIDGDKQNSQVTDSYLPIYDIFQRKYSGESNFQKLFETGVKSVPSVSTPRAHNARISKAVNVEHTPAKGRHYIASRDINPGELLVVEEALFSVTPLGHELRQYCGQCLRRAPVPVPCPTCSLVIFCSLPCREISMSQAGAHLAECSILPMLIDLKPDIDAALAFRALSSSSMTEVMRLHQQLVKYDRNAQMKIEGDMKIKTESGDDVKKVKPEGNKNASKTPKSTVKTPLMYLNRSLSSLYNLDGHIQSRDPKDLLEACIASVILTRLMLCIPQISTEIGSVSDNKYQVKKEESATFKRNKSNISEQLESVSEKDLITLGSQIMRLLLIIQCNCHLVKELRPKSSKHITNAKLEIVGYAIYCDLSLVNHSCAPNALHSSLGRSKFMYAASHILKGQEINDSYGERFVTHKLKERMENLEKVYFFKCNCEACQQNWPLYSELPLKFSLKCLKCCNPIDMDSSKCNKCQILYSNQNKQQNQNSSKKSKKPQTNITLYDASEIKVKVAEAWAEFGKIRDSFNNENLRLSDLNKITEVLYLIDKYAVKPNHPYIEAQEMLYRYYDLMGSVYFK